MARWASVRMGIVARAEAPAAKRKKLRREKPLQVVGSTTGMVIIEDSFMGRWANCGEVIGQ
jgi:hypothetical protein